MKKTRVIKRYQNRKLYDTHQSSYVTLEEIAEIIREGYEIKVIDNKTKEDITYITQVQLLFVRERKSAHAEDVALLQKVVREGKGTFTEYIKVLGLKIKQLNNALKTAGQTAGATGHTPEVMNVSYANGKNIVSGEAANPQ